jgi:hypothetical protein
MKNSSQKIGSSVFDFITKTTLAGALYGVLGLLLLYAAAAKAQPYEPIEIWVTPFGSGGGSGTPDDPYSTPTADSFFNLINDQRTVCITNASGTNCGTVIIPEYSTIHLMPGTFIVREGNNNAGQPRHCITMKQGWKIRGAGMDSTVIQVTNNATPAEGNRIDVFGCTAVTGSPGLGIDSTPLLYAEVSDLTVDCNLQNQSTATTPCVQAVVMHGTHNKVSRVKTINWGSTSASVEMFVFNLDPHYALSASDSEDGLIEDCVATQPAPVAFPGGGGVFTAGGDSDSGDARHQAWKIRGCIVRDVNVSAAFYAYGPGNGCEVSDCIAENLTGGNTAAVYNDTVDYHDQIYRNNTFLNVDSGITYNGSDNDVSNIVILNNLITSTNVNNGWGINLYMPNHSMRGVRIEGNIVRPVFPGASMTGALGINGIAAPITFSADNNVLDAGGGWDFYCNGPFWTNLNCLSFVNNLNSRGQPLMYGDSSSGITSKLNKFYDDQLTFTPTSSGWWKVVPWPHSGSRIELWSFLTTLDIGLAYQQTQGNAAGGELTMLYNETDQAGGYNPVPQVRITSYSDGSDAFEAYISTAQVGYPITVRLSGMFRAMINGYVPSPVSATPTETLVLNIGPGIRTTGPIYAGLSGGAVQEITDSAGHIVAAALNIVEPAQGGLGQNASGVAANEFPYTTGTGTFGFAPLTSYTLGLLNSANAAAAQSTLQLVAGVTAGQLTANRALISGASQNITNSTVTATELGYVSGVTNSIQTQLNTLYTSGPQKMYQTADQSIGTTAANVNGLSFPVAANKDYGFEFTIVVTNSSTARGYQLAFNGPSSPLELTAKMEVPASSSSLGSGGTSYGVTSYGTFVGPGAGGPGTARIIATICGTFRNGSNAGTLTVQAQSVGGAGTVTIKQGSWGYYWPLN